MAGPPTRRPRRSRCSCPPSARRRSGAPAIWWSRLGRAAGDLSPWGSDLAARRGVSSRRRAQHQPVSRFALDLRAGVDEREILAFRPKRQQVVVVLTAGLARLARHARRDRTVPVGEVEDLSIGRAPRSEEHTSELQSLAYLVCRLLLEKKNITKGCEKIHNLCGRACSRV